MAGIHPDGLFSWVDLLLRDPDAGKEFYTGLFGWEAEDQEDEKGTYLYTQFTVDGSMVAGLGPLPPGSLPDGVPPAWTSYINVDDVDAVAEAVGEQGGTLVMGPMDVGPAGRTALIADPEGALVGFWQPGDHPGGEVFGVPGSLVWNELYTRDVSGAKEFYGAVLPWTYRRNPDAATEYWVIELEGKRGDDPTNGGIMAMDRKWGDLPAHWMPYFAVGDAAGAAARVEELGGAVPVAPFEAGIGTIAVCADPEGAHFSIWAPPTA